MEGITYGILLMISLYLIPIFCFFATIFFGLKAIYNTINQIRPNLSKSISILFASVFLFSAFVWPSNFSIFLQNTELYRTIYFIQISLVPISILIFLIWLRLKYCTAIFINMFIVYGIIDLLVKAPRIFESIYKIIIDDHRPYATGYSAFIGRYLVQINLVSAVVLLLAIYSLFIYINTNKTNNAIKQMEDRGEVHE